jgi:hypothetical protein
MLPAARERSRPLRASLSPNLLLEDLFELFQPNASNFAAHDALQMLRGRMR